MHDLNRSAGPWNGPGAYSFAVCGCFVYWALSIAGSFGTDYTTTISWTDVFKFTIDTKFIFTMAAPFVPAFYCLRVYPECRSSLTKVNASLTLYFVAVATGLCLPFLSYPGTRYLAFPWGQEVTLHLGTVFALNLFLAPMWEEIVWRGCFLKKVRSFSSASRGILLMSVGWTIWSGADIALPYRTGAPVDVLCVWLATSFCLGIILGSVFEMGSGSLWPCILLHSAFNAGTLIYYSESNHAFELGSYVSELMFTAIAAALFFWIAIRRSRPSVEASGLVVPQA